MPAPGYLWPRCKQNWHGRPRLRGARVASSLKWRRRRAGLARRGGKMARYKLEAEEQAALAELTTGAEWSSAVAAAPSLRRVRTALRRHGEEREVGEAVLAERPDAKLKPWFLPMRAWVLGSMALAGALS